MAYLWSLDDIIVTNASGQLEYLVCAVSEPGRKLCKHGLIVAVLILVLFLDSKEVMHDSVIIDHLLDNLHSLLCWNIVCVRWRDNYQCIGSMADRSRMRVVLRPKLIVQCDCTFVGDDDAVVMNRCR